MRIQAFDQTSTTQALNTQQMAAERIAAYQDAAKPPEVAAQRTSQPRRDVLQLSSEALALLKENGLSATNDRQAALSLIKVLFMQNPIMNAAA